MQETQVWSLGQQDPWRRKLQPTPVFLPGKSHGQKSLEGLITVHEVAEGRTRLSDFNFTFHFHAWRRKWQPTPVFLPGESQGRGSLVGCCLWGRTWLWGQTQLKQLSSSSSSSNFLVSFLGSPVYNMSSAKSEIFISCFSNWIPFIYFSSLIYRSRTLKIVLKKSGKSGQPVLFQILQEMLSVFQH